MLILVLAYMPDKPFHRQRHHRTATTSTSLSRSRRRITEENVNKTIRPMSINSIHHRHRRRRHRLQPPMLKHRHDPHQLLTSASYTSIVQVSSSTHDNETYCR
jgi:hypothetical protein